MKVFFAVLVVIALLFVTSFLFRMAATPFNVVDKVVNADNIVDSYKMFYSRYAEIESSIETAKQTKSVIESMERDFNLRNADGSLNQQAYDKLSVDNKIRYDGKRDGLQIQVQQLNQMISQYNALAKDKTQGIFNGTGCSQIENCQAIPQLIPDFQ